MGTYDVIHRTCLLVYREQKIPAIITGSVELTAKTHASAIQIRIVSNRADLLGNSRDLSAMCLLTLRLRAKIAIAPSIQKVILKLAGAHKTRGFSRISNYKLAPITLTVAQKTGLNRV
jgi:hypothetical protein